MGFRVKTPFGFREIVGCADRMITETVFTKCCLYRFKSILGADSVFFVSGSKHPQVFLSGTFNGAIQVSLGDSRGAFTLRSKRKQRDTRLSYHGSYDTWLLH